MKKHVLEEKAEKPYEYKSELELMQEAYDGCCGRPGCKHQMDAFKKNPLPYEPAEEDAEEWEDEDYGDDGMDDTFDSDMEGFEEESDGIDPSDLSEIVSDVNEYIKEKLIEFGYSESMVGEVIANLSEGGDGLSELDASVDDYDARAGYDEENYGFEDEESKQLTYDQTFDWLDNKANSLDLYQWLQDNADDTINTVVKNLFTYRLNDCNVKLNKKAVYDYCENYLSGWENYNDEDEEDIFKPGV